MLAIKNNLMAQTAARHLGTSYDSLAQSVERLSSGLRINSAKDDAAGLAVRELIRSDVASLQQGSRNAADAVSMLQAAEGGMAIMDNVLVRMRELAEQASTGSYSVEQKAIMQQEFEQLALEVTRIANNTQFNGNNMLMADATGAMTISLGAGAGDDAQVIKVDTHDVRATHLGIVEDKDAVAHTHETLESSFTVASTGAAYITDSDVGEKETLSVLFTVASVNDAYIAGIDPGDTDPVSLKVYSGAGGVTAAIAIADGTSKTLQEIVDAINADGTATVSAEALETVTGNGQWYLKITADANGAVAGSLTLGNGAAATYTDMGWGTHAANHAVAGAGDFALHEGVNPVAKDVVISVGDTDITVTGAVAGGGNTTLAALVIAINSASGASTNVVASSAETYTGSSQWYLKLTAVAEGNIGEADAGISIAPDANLTWSDSTAIDVDGDFALTDGIDAEAATTQTMLSDVSISGDASEAIDVLEAAIAEKDNYRAHLGYMMNRLEAAGSVIDIQAENLAAAESRISDVDVALEMAAMTRGQVLAQAGVSMLAQANSMPQMALQLLRG